MLRCVTPSNRMIAGIVRTLPFAIALLVLALIAFQRPDDVAAAPDVTLAPASGAAGTVVQVSGNGWTAGASLTLLWDRGQRVAEAVANSSGAFMSSFVAPQGATPGSHAVVVLALPPGATLGSGGQPPAGAPFSMGGQMNPAPAGTQPATAGACPPAGQMAPVGGAPNMAIPSGAIPIGGQFVPGGQAPPGGQLQPGGQLPGGQPPISVQPPATACATFTVTAGAASAVQPSSTPSATAAATAAATATVSPTPMPALVATVTPTPTQTPTPTSTATPTPTPTLTPTPTPPPAPPPFSLSILDLNRPCVPAAGQVICDAERTRLWNGDATMRLAVGDPATLADLAQAMQWPHVRINATRFRGRTSTELDEWVEVKNLGGAPQEMGRWSVRVEGTPFRWTFAEGFVLEPGQACKFYTGAAMADPCGGSSTIAPMGVLPNEGGLLTLWVDFLELKAIEVRYAADPTRQPPPPNLQGFN